MDRQVPALRRRQAVVQDREQRERGEQERAPLDPDDLAQAARDPEQRERAEQDAAPARVPEGLNDNFVDAIVDILNSFRSNNPAYWDACWDWILDQLPHFAVVLCFVQT
ncbi:hypothetical protein PTSG_02607 [Salpingoeca rosetta]|uniref:Uncharacterized protein n=1 Tax=Salpingoeca rosetta (strain ATCC 50818 / BSB-021) TaxID=946362 RepID=F2U2S7_SALR5|nr:uncharacterized protein PTSG_02607 [Salpingoeca rosetta]EGD81921.1 hypothetical protein PTSG_02607 [Salpingoeca rosetta]|eukprot:XP_004996104.1 hypothetical protein PTSG_02607 [Salpingoeca rosetta]